MTITKRDGTEVPFDSSKIKAAAFKALQAVGIQSEAIADTVTEDVVKHIETYAEHPTVEYVQDLVETALAKRGLTQAAKEFILYRDQRRRDRKGKGPQVDIYSLVDGYIDGSDWRVRENANSGVSYASLQNYIGGSVTAQYALYSLYPEEIRNLHIDGDVHIHDLSCGIVPYCSGHSLRDLLEQGFRGTPDKASAKPAKYLLTALQQAANYLATLQTEFAGAQAFSSFDTYMAPFIRVNEETGEIMDKPALSYKRVKQCIQTFLFCINVASRWGQSPFTNVTLDISVPSDLAGVPVLIGGKRIDGLYYGDLQEEMDMFNTAFIELMTEGDGEGKAFSFPIPTYNLTKDFNWDSPVADKLFALTAKYGIPYFQNFVNSDIDPQDTRSMCCRLRLDLKELVKKTGGLFGNGELTGSVGVWTLNLPRIGYMAKGDRDVFYDRLDYLLEKGKEALEIKRKQCEKAMADGLMPYASVYVKHFNTYFSTIGIIGMNECCLNFLGCSIADKKGKEFAVEVLKHINEKIAEFQEETGHLYNSEGVPGEGTCYRLARIDKKLHPDIVTAGVAAPYYTNSSHLPVGYTDDPFEALDHQDDLQTLYTGGTVLHIFLGEPIDDPQQCKKLVKAIVDNYRLPAFTITPTYSICPTHGYIAGNHPVCPVCSREPGE